MQNSIINNIFLYIYNNFIFLIIALVIVFVLLMFVLTNSSKIKIIKDFIIKSFKLIKIIISEPISILFDMTKFNIKRFLLSYSLCFKLKNKNNEFICSISFNIFIFLIFLFILGYVTYSTNEHYNSILLMLEGAIISIWVTHLINIILSLIKLAQNLNRNFTTISTVLQTYSSIYELFIGLFPYNDDLFKKGADILYVTPYGHPDKPVLEEKSALVLLEYIKGLDRKELLKHFNADNAKTLAQLLSKTTNNLSTTHNLLISNADFLPISIIDLFEQIISLLGNIINLYSMYNNLDPSLIEKVSDLYVTYIYKLVCAILFVQNEQLIYKKYISHVSHPPMRKHKLTLTEAIEINKANL